MIKIRLQRGGRKKKPIYRIVAADSRATRDGKFIQKLGLYNPNTQPATIDLDFNAALDWVMKGAQPSDTARRLLSEKGVMFRKHLQQGVEKGAITQENADSRFEAWLNTKSSQLQKEIMALNDKKDSEKKARVEAELKVKEEREAAQAAALAALQASETEVAAEEVSEEAAETAVEASAEESATETTTEENA